jgi:hypothetical protein
MSGELTVVKPQDYAITISSEQVTKALRENLGGRPIGKFDLERVKVPSQGSTFFAVNTLEGEQSVKELKGIILNWSEKRMYWKDKIGTTGAGAPPDCASEDGDAGVGEPGGACAKCKYAQFGSAVKDNGDFGKGQACKLVRYLLIVKKEDMIPFVLCVPPSSLGHLRKMFLRLSSKGMPYYQVEVAFTLEKAQSGDGITYSTIMPRVSGVLDKDTITAIEKYREQVRGAFENVDVQEEDYHAVNQ